MTPLNSHDHRPSQDSDPNRSDPAVSRRRFLTGAAMAGAALASGCADQLASPLLRRSASLRSQLDSDSEGEEHGIPDFEHVIVVMQENRSFDHMLGWLPRADGRQAGLKYADRDGVFHHTKPLAPDFQGCGFNDPDHSYGGGRIQFNDGQCDGFLRSGDNDPYSIGYYVRQDLDFYGQAMTDWATSDRYFCSFLGPTFPNRFYQHAAQTDRISNTLVLSQLPTIWDRLAAAGLTGRYYFSDLAFTLLWGAKYQSITRPLAQFLAECAAGTLPNVAFIDPKFGGEEAGTSNDDHPFGDIRAGQHFLHQIYTAVTNGPLWEKTVLVINYDEWGGFFDHVPPPIRPISAITRAAGDVDGRLGFRTPLLVVSPFARRGQVGHDVLDHTSILRMIEKRWQLAPLSERDASARSLATLLDFDAEPRSAPQYPVPPIEVGAVCPAAPAATIASANVRATSMVAARTDRSHWRELRSRAVSARWGMTSERAF